MTIEELNKFCKDLGMVRSSGFLGCSVAWTFPGEQYNYSAFVRCYETRVHICARLSIWRDTMRIKGNNVVCDLTYETRQIKKMIETMCADFKKLTKELRMMKIDEL